MICSIVSRGDSDDSGSWKTTWISLRMLRRSARSLQLLLSDARSRPRDAIRPRTASASVVLPEPDSPMTPSVSPGARSKSTDSTAVKRPLLNQPRMPGSRVG